MNDQRKAVYNPKSMSYEFTFNGIVSEIMQKPKFTAKGKVYREGYAKIKYPNGEVRKVLVTLWEKSYQLHTDAFAEGMPVEVISQSSRDASTGKIRTFCKMQLPTQSLNLSDFNVTIDFEQENDVVYDGLSEEQLAILDSKRKAIAASYKAEQEFTNPSIQEQTIIADNVIDRELVS